MLRLTPQQVGELSEIVDRYTHLFIGVHIGRDFLTPDVLANLARHGVALPALSAPNYLDTAFRFGLMSTVLGNEVTKHFTFDQLKRYMEAGKFIPLTGQEQRALNFVRNRAYNDIKGLGNRISKDLTGELTNSKAQAAQYRDLIRDTAVEAIENRKDAKWLAGELANKSKDWARDFHRIADYLMHEAFDTARAQGYLKLYGPMSLVFKDVYEYGCPTCQRLYLTNGLGSEPKTFTLLELINNGSNIGRNSKEVKAVIGPTHPYCRCTLNNKPLGSTWDADKQQFTLQRYTDEKASDRIRNRTSRVKVTITP